MKIYSNDNKFLTKKEIYLLKLTLINFKSFEIYPLKKEKRKIIINDNNITNINLRKFTIHCISDDKIYEVKSGFLSI